MAAINWKTGISGNWSQASNWSTGNVPGIGDNVTVDATGSYAVTFDGFNNPVSSLAFNAPTARIAMASSRSLQVEEATMITGGTIDGPGGFFTGGVVSITGQPLTLGGELIWDTYAPRLLTTSDVNISSAINVGDAAGLTATIRNRGTFNLTTDSAGIGLNLVVGSLGIANFDNGFGGTLAKTGGTGTSHFFANYTDISNINIGSGAVVISTGTLEFDGSNNFGGSISGEGTVAFGSGSSQFRVNPTVSNFLIGGGSVTFSNTLNYFGNFAETGGVLTLGGNTPTITGFFTMTGGALNFNGGATFTLPATIGFAGGTVTGGTVAMNGNTAVTGTTLIRAKVVNNGTIAANAGTLDLVGAVSGNGQIIINPGAAVELSQASAATQRVNFAGGASVLTIDQPGLFQSPISGFQATDVIDLGSLSLTSTYYSSGHLTFFNGTTPVVQLTVSTPYARNAFALTPDGVGGTYVTVSPLPPPPSPSDFNHDGNSDVLWQNDSGAVVVWEMNGVNSIGGGGVGNPGPTWHAYATGDFNGDGFADILWQNNDGTAAIWEANGTAVIGGGTVGNPGATWHVKGIGDFNGDGLSDILWQNDNGVAAVWELNGITVIGGGTVGNPGPTWHIIGSGDFNGDVRSDILWQNNSGQIAIWGMNGANVLGGGNVANPGANWHAICIGDFNGDGLSDILLQHTSGQVAIWEMNGTSIIAGGTVGNPGAGSHALHTGDYNNDGRSDILFQNSSGEAAIWEISGTSVIGGGSLGNPGPTWHI